MSDGYSRWYLLNEVFKHKFENMKIGRRQALNQVPQGEQTLAPILNAGDVCQLIHLICWDERRKSFGEEIFQCCCNSIHWDVQFPDRN